MPLAHGVPTTCDQEHYFPTSAVFQTTNFYQEQNSSSQVDLGICFLSYMLSSLPLSSGNETNYLYDLG